MNCYNRFYQSKLSKSQQIRRDTDHSWVPEAEWFTLRNGKKSRIYFHEYLPDNVYHFKWVSYLLHHRWLNQSSRHHDRQLFGRLNRRVKSRGKEEAQGSWLSRVYQLLGQGWLSRFLNFIWQKIFQMRFQQKRTRDLSDLKILDVQEAQYNM